MWKGETKAPPGPPSQRRVEADVPASAAPNEVNGRAVEVEVERIGSVLVAWPRRRCAVCERPVPQVHGMALLAVEGQPTCWRCYTLARALGDCGGLVSVRRVLAGSW